MSADEVGMRHRSYPKLLGVGQALQMLCGSAYARMFLTAAQELYLEGFVCFRKKSYL